LSFGASYLHHPDLFPARLAGEPWGEAALELDFAGGPYRFSGLSRRQEEELRERFGPLCAGSAGVSPASSPRETTLFRLAENELKRPDLTGTNYTFDRRPAEKNVALAGWDFLALIEMEPLRGGLWTPEDGGLAFDCLLENYFRVLVAYRLLELGGVLLHSSAAVSGGKAHLFLGPSGAGKTTAARKSKSRGLPVLSDDINALCPQGEAEVVVEKLPFAGEMAQEPTPRQSWPLGSLHRLEKGGHSREKLRPAQTLALLLSCAPFVNADPWRNPRLVENLEGLVRAFPAFELRTERDADFWPLIEAAPA
jgi:hypothetical protein